MAKIVLVRQTPSIPARELACFHKPLAGHEAAESILVTNDYEDVIDIAAGRVQCIPVAKFLLGLGEKSIR